jgi:hypothetical protein
MGIGPGAFLVGVPLWVLISSVPGFLLASAVDPLRPAVERWAVAPPVSLAVAFASASGSNALGIRSAPVVVIMSLGLVSVACAVVLTRRADRTWRPPRMTAPSLALLGTMGVALVGWLVVLATAPTRWGSLLPNVDGSAHGVVLSRILQTGSVDWRVVTRLDLAGSGSDSQFYPLGLHAFLAPLAAVTNVPAALVIAFVVASSVWVPLGVVALGRSLVGARAAVPAAVIATLLIPWFPFSQMASGVLPLVVAVGLVPAVAAALLVVGAGRRLVVPALALGGLTAVHATEVVVVGLLVGLTWLLGGGLRSRIASFGWAAVAGAAALVVALPTTLGLLGGGAALPQDVPLGGSWDSAVIVVLSDPFLGYLRPTGASGAWLVVVAGCGVGLALVGCLDAWRRRTGRGLVALLVGLVLLAVAADVGVRWIVMRPWYSNGERISIQLAALLPLVLAAGSVVVFDALRSRTSRRTTVAVLGVAAILVALPLAARSVETAWSAVADHSVVTEADRAAFGWLASRARPGERVLNDNRDGSVWMYADTGGAAVPVFSGNSNPDWSELPAWQDRVGLLQNIERVGSDPTVRDAARAWSVRYVMVGERTIGGGHRRLDPAALATAPGLRLVFSQGDARVYEIVSP